MAEVVAVIGAIAACSQLVEGFGKLSRTIRTTSKGMHYVPKYISELRNGTEIFIICLKKLIRAADKLYRKEPDSEGAQETRRGLTMIKSQGRLLKKEIHELMRRVQGQRRSSTVMCWLDKFGVLLNQGSIQCLQKSLDRLIQHIASLASGVILDDLIAKVESLEAQNLPVPPDLIEEM